MLPTQPPRLVLASTSSRRQELLRAAGYQFEVDAPAFEEPDEHFPHVNAGLYAESLAYFKARSVAARHFSKTILAADTVSLHEGEVIGKPLDRDDARRILRKLCGTTHQVITGIALLAPSTGHRLLQHDVSTVHMRPGSEAMIEAYLASGAWNGKAGAYGIQDRDDPFVEHYTGSYSNIVGLPMELLARMFQSWMQMQAAATRRPAADCG